MKFPTVICSAIALLVSISITSATEAQQQPYADGPVTIVPRWVPDFNAVKRQPLSTLRINTTSTRLVDARRGLRPFSSVYGSGNCASHTGYPDAYTYGYFVRTPRTGVTVHRNDRNDDAVQESTMKQSSQADQKSNHSPKFADGWNRDLANTLHNDNPHMVVRTPKARTSVTVHRNGSAKPVIETRRIKKRDIGVAQADQAKDTVTVYRTPKLPKASGAVLVAADGTIYTIGD